MQVVKHPYQQYTTCIRSATTTPRPLLLLLLLPPLSANLYVMPSTSVSCFVVSVRHVEALRARDSNNDNENNATPFAETPLAPNSSPSPPSVHGPGLAYDCLDQLYHSCSPEPPPAIQEAILLGALETMDQGYQVTALHLGTLLQPPELGTRSPAPSANESSTTLSSDTEARITYGNLTSNNSVSCALLY